MFRNNLHNHVAHVGVGVAVGALARRLPVLACILAGGFFLYQVVEMIRKHQVNKASKDNAYPEIKEFLVGVGMGAAADAADAAVYRGRIRTRLGAWRGRWARAVREVVGAAQPAEDRVAD